MPLRLPSADTAFGATPTQRPNRVASYDQTGIGQGDLAEGLGAVQGARGLAEAERIGAQVAAQGEQAARIQGDTASIAARTASQLGGIQATRVSDLATQAEIVRTTAKSEESVGKAVADLGPHIAHYAEVQRVAQVAMQQARADSHRLVNSSKLKEAMDDDTAYQGMEDRYGQQADDVFNQSAGMITDPREAELYRLKHAPDLEALKLKARTRADTLIKDEDRAVFNQNLENLRQTLINSTDPIERLQVIDAVRNEVRGMQDLGRISAVEATTLERKWLENAGKGSTGSKPWADQLTDLRGFEGALIGSESSGRPAQVNSKGYAGLYQFGAPRLEAIGAYTPGEDEPRGKGWSQSDRFSAGKWSGTFNIPGFENVKTLQDFLNSPEAQRKAFQMHLAKMDEEIKTNGFDKYEGQTVGGVPINRNALYGMMHLGGVGSTKSFLSGKGDPSDGATRVSDYGLKFGRIQSSPLAQFIPADDAIGMYEHARAQLAAQAERTDQAKRSEVAAVTSLAKDDEASIMATGKPVESLTGDRVAAALGPEKAAAFERNRAGAIRYYEATHDWTEVPSTVIQQRLENLRPVPGQVGYENQQAFYNTAKARSDEITKERTNDPAAAADRLPELAVVKQQASLDKPETYLPLVKARAIAQERLGIPEDLRTPITRAEAQQLWRPIEQSASDAERKDVLDGTVRQLMAAFGDEADTALAAILKEGRVSRETRKVAASILTRLTRENSPPPPEAAQALSDAAKADATARAVQSISPTTMPYAIDPWTGATVPTNPPVAPSPPIPNAADINDLRARPETAPAFDRHFGEGQAEKILRIVRPGQVQKPAEQKPPEPARKKVSILRGEDGRIAGVEYS
jgi:hypothetical protein